jgi:pimeloyl-ACP methyl ester carboxylesterase
MAVRRASVRGIGIAFEEHGQGERPFVLVHGFTGSRDDFREVLPRLAARGRTLALDLRGHGQSSNPGEPDGYSFDELARDLSAFLDAVGVAHCDLLGHSMGGMIALRLALAEPRRVDSLVLMDTAAEPLPIAVRPFLEAAGRMACERGMETLFRIQREGMERDGGMPPAQRRSLERMGAEAYWARLRAKLVAMDPVAFATLGPRLADTPGVAARLDEIRCPTTVLVGAEDALLRGAADLLARDIAGARLAVIEGAAHSPQLENPAAWLAAVEGHLDAARASAPAAPPA